MQPTLPMSREALDDLFPDLYEEPTSGVYRFMSKTTGSKGYGFSKDIYKTWTRMLEGVIEGVHGNLALQASCDLHGLADLELTIVERDVVNNEERKLYWMELDKTYLEGGFNTLGERDALIRRITKGPSVSRLADEDKPKLKELLTMLDWSPVGIVDDKILEKLALIHSNVVSRC